MKKTFFFYLDCTRCRNLLCKASCYYKNNGFDYGYCNEKNSCICVTPEIYLFDGLQNYSDINDSLSNDNLIQNLVNIIFDLYFR